VKRTLAVFMALLIFTLAGCGKEKEQPPQASEPETSATEITLSDSGITVDGETVPTDKAAAVYTANDIVYYEAGKDFTYGEGTEADAHTEAEAAAHTVLHITKPGTYSLSGSISKGQVAVDLGSDAEENETAVVTLILDGLDITCEVAPAIIFYNVYECGDKDEPAATVDTSAAGANVIIADGSENTVNGSYVARIYKPESVVLTEDGSAVEDASKLHKYDAAFYSKMSMNVSGGSENTGKLTINAENEGLDSELHLTVNGGNIKINSGNDGINTNEDGVSVTTINGGTLDITVTGQTGEGDGIDSNGWLVINGGSVIARACSSSEDAGIDSDMGIYINGGTVAATGHMLDRIEDGGQTYAVFTFDTKQSGDETVRIALKDGEPLFETSPQNSYSVLIYSSPELKVGTYTLSCDGQTLSVAASGGMMGAMPGKGMRPEDAQPGKPLQLPEGVERPEGFERPGGEKRPEGMTPPEDMEMPEDAVPPEGELIPEDMTPPEGGVMPDMPRGDREEIGELSQEFDIVSGGNMFRVVSGL